MTTDINVIYGPVRDGLERVDAAIESVVSVEGSFLAQLLGHILKGGGKRIRPAITLLAGHIYRYDLKLLVPQATAVELLHTATLVHDDIIDESLTRRNKATINAMWGDTRAILLGDYLFAKAAEMCAATGNVRVIELCARTLMTISGGELEQSAFEFSLERVRDQYYRWIAAKTAALFAMAAESGGILSGAPEESVQALRTCGRNLGMAFQIVDDVLDFAGDETEMGKPTGEDLRQGVLTLPAILYIENNRDDRILKKVNDLLKTRDEKKLKQAAQKIRQSPYIKVCMDIAADYSATARQALAALPDNPAKHSLLDLIDYALERKK